MRFALTSMSTTEVADARVALQERLSPDAFNGLVKACWDRLSWGEFFNVPALGFLRDAWTLGRFASLSGADEVWLAQDNFPDGHVIVSGRRLDVEVTEAMMPDRRRGQEFLPGSPGWVEDPGHEWDRRINALPAVLAKAIERKAAKAYSVPPTLVIYLNVSAYGHREEECQAAIHHLVELHGSRFAGLHVLWQGQLYPAPP